MAPLPCVELGSQGLKVTVQGLGCMGLTAFYGQPGKPIAGVSEEEGLALLRAAADAGVTFWDTAQLYCRHNPDTDSTEYNETLLGKALKELGREKFVVATKTGIRFDPKIFSLSIDGTPEFIRQSCEESLKRLGIDTIDLYYLHRIDQKTPIETSMQVLKELVNEGKIKYIGLSESSAATIRRAHAVHPITAVQMEYSLWSRDIEAEVIPTCVELGIGLVAYSPLGRGILTGTIKKADDIAGADFRSRNPRFAGDALGANVALVEKLEAVAAKKGCAVGQLALAWVSAKGAQFGLKGCVAIPGTTRPTRLLENVGATSITLSAEEVAAAEAAVPIDAVVGGRYDEGSITHSTDKNPETAL